MKTDRYTKAVLTVIAVCLTILVMGQFGWVTPAQAEKMPVVNAGANRSGDMQYVSIEGGAGTSYYSPLYVQVVD